MNVWPEVRASGRSADLQPREILPHAWGTDRAKEAVIDTLQAAREDFADVVKLTRELVRVPSRGGIDSVRPGAGDHGRMAGRPRLGVPG